MKISTTPLLQTGPGKPSVFCFTFNSLFTFFVCVGLLLIILSYGPDGNTDSEISVGPGVIGWPFWENVLNHEWWKDQPCTGVRRDELYKALHALHATIGFNAESPPLDGLSPPPRIRSSADSGSPSGLSPHPEGAAHAAALGQPSVFAPLPGPGIVLPISGVPPIPIPNPPVVPQPSEGGASSSSNVPGPSGGGASSSSSVLGALTVPNAPPIVAEGGNPLEAFRMPSEDYILQNSCFGSHRCTFAIQYWISCLKSGIPQVIKGLAGLEIRAHTDEYRTLTLWDYTKMFRFPNVIWFGTDVQRPANVVFEYALGELQQDEFALVMLYIPILGGKNMLHMWFIEITTTPVERFTWRIYSSWVDKFNLKYWMGESDVLCENNPFEIQSIREARDTYGRGKELGLQDFLNFQIALNTWSQIGFWEPLQNFLGGGVGEGARVNRAVVINAMKYYLEPNSAAIAKGRHLQKQQDKAREQKLRPREAAERSRQPDISRMPRIREPGSADSSSPAGPSSGQSGGPSAIPKASSVDSGLRNLEEVRRGAEVLNIMRGSPSSDDALLARAAAESLPFSPVSQERSSESPRSPKSRKTSRAKDDMNI